MSCVLRIQGNKFKAQGYLIETSFKAYKTWQIGEPVIPKRKDISHPIANGFNIDVSAANFDQFKKQKNDATKFLKNNFNKLKRLYEFGLSESDSSTLDFAINTRMYDVGCQVDRFEPDLLRLAGELNFTIELSQYKT